MKIGIDCRLWNESGVGRYTRNLVKELQILDKNNSYSLFVLSKDKLKILNQVKNDNFRIVKADIRWHTIEEQIKFPQILNKENLDLMHFPYFSVPIFYNKSYVVTIHDLIIHHFPTGQASTLGLPLYNLKLLGYKFIITSVAKKAKKIITVSNATKKEIIDHLGVNSNKITVTYEGVSLVSPKEILTRRYTLYAKRYFLYVGNAYPHKNLERLLEAFMLLRQNDIKLVLVGKEDFFYKRLKEKVKNMGLEKSIEFLGEVSDQNLTNLYRNAKALIVPSLMEGFGLPALEAMANKCLVLASDVPSLREICKDTAIYFDPYNPKNIEEKMKDVCFNNLNHFSNNIEKGFERAKLFSWQKMAKETLRLYESCVGLR